MRKILLYIFIFISFISISQTDSTETVDSSHISLYEAKKPTSIQLPYIGTEFSAKFGNSIFAMIQPLAGYEFWGGISAGAQLTYQYRIDNPASSIQSYSSHTFGGGVFARWRPTFWPYCFLQTEFALYNTEDLISPEVGDRTNVPSLMVGLGAVYSFGRSYVSVPYFYATLLYDFLRRDNMPIPEIFSGVPLRFRLGFVYYLNKN